MLYYALIFFVIALVAALFGFSGIATGAVDIARVLFLIFAAMAVFSWGMPKGPERRRKGLFDSLLRKTGRSVDENFDFIDQVIWRGERRRDGNELFNAEQRGSHDENDKGNERREDG
jgi:uncharacterized membrane protein YtjA (UPF0391 family)